MNDGGSWTGPWRGSVEPGGIAGRPQGFYEGPGAHAGLRYRYSQTDAGSSLRTTGTIEAVDTAAGRGDARPQRDLHDRVMGTQEVVDGVIQYRDMVLSCGSIRSSDPRLAATTDERVVINVDKRA